MEPITDNPPSKESTHCGYCGLTPGFGLALCALLMLISAGVGYRLEVWNFRTGFTIIQYAAYLGIAAGLVILTSIIIAIKKGRRVKIISVVIAGTMAVTAVAIPFSWKQTARRLPRIHDISTDLENPPHFVAVLPLRQGATNPVEYGGPEIAAKQKTAYPEIQPLIMDIPADQAFARSLKAAKNLCWEIVAEEPAEGRIEATATTLWFGFKDDIVIRITPLGNRAQIDIRSLSRVGVSDAGANAKRIRAFLRKLSKSST